MAVQQADSPGIFRGNLLFVAAVCCFLKLSAASVKGLLAEISRPPCPPRYALGFALGARWGSLGRASSGSFQRRPLLSHTVWELSLEYVRIFSAAILTIADASTHELGVVLWREPAQPGQDEQQLPWEITADRTRHLSIPRTSTFDLSGCC